MSQKQWGEQPVFMRDRIEVYGWLPQCSDHIIGEASGAREIGPGWDVRPED